MPRTKGSKNKPKTVTADFATQLAEKQSAKEALTAEIASMPFGLPMKQRTKSFVLPIIRTSSIVPEQYSRSTARKRCGIC